MSFFQYGKCRSVTEFEKQSRVGEGTYGIVCKLLSRFTVFNLKSTHAPIFTFSKLVMNLQIFATIYSLMNDINLIDSCQAHLPVQYAWNIEFICQK